MSARWDMTQPERRAALLETRHPALTLALVALLLILLTGCALVAG